jgi:hypothetical protein
MWGNIFLEKWGVGLINPNSAQLNTQLDAIGGKRDPCYTPPYANKIIKSKNKKTKTIKQIIK